MSYVLKRPMFRLGGQSADGVGITSGFNRRNYADGTYGKQLEEEMAKATAKPKFGTDELIAEAYRTVGGASDWKDWIKQGSDRALEIQEERKGLPAKNVDMLIKAQAGEADWMTKSKPGRISDQYTAMDSANQILNQYEDFAALLASGELQQWDFLMGIANDNWVPIVKQKAQIEIMVREQEITPGVKEFQDETEIQEEINKRLNNLMNYLKKTTGVTQPRIPEAQGGRVGLQQSFPGTVEQAQLSEQVDTPRGDVSITEDITMDQPQMPQAGVAPTSGNDDPYIMLRARLPQEIPDDVVRLIAYNPEAFADFAAIETQEDVMAFNQKYSVELFVNTD